VVEKKRWNIGTFLDNHDGGRKEIVNWHYWGILLRLINIYRMVREMIVKKL
jgi:hypothetical protein